MMWGGFSKTDTGGKSFGGRKGQRNLCVFLRQVAINKQQQMWFAESTSMLKAPCSPLSVTFQYFDSLIYTVSQFSFHVDEDWQEMVEQRNNYLIFVAAFLE